MGFFSYAFKQKDKGLGKAFIYALFLALIFTVSFVVVYLKAMSFARTTEFKNELQNSFSCQVLDYKLVCDKNLVRYGDLVIDLDKAGVYGENDIVLTRDKVIISTYTVTYDQILKYMGHDDGNYTTQDLVNTIQDLISALTFFIAVGGFVFSYLFFIIGNALLAFIMLMLINGILKTEYYYRQMYILTMIVSLPYVLLNGVFRLFFNNNLSGLITYKLPVYSGLAQVIIDYAIIFGLTYLAVKEGMRTESKEEKTPEM